MEIVLDKTAVRQIRLSAQDAIEELERLYKLGIHGPHCGWAGILGYGLIQQLWLLVDACGDLEQRALDVDALGACRQQGEDPWGDQAVVQRDVGALHQLDRAHGEQVRVARPGADEVDLAAGGAQFGQRVSAVPFDPVLAGELQDGLAIEGLPEPLLVMEGSALQSGVRSLELVGLVHQPLVDGGVDTLVDQLGHLGRRRADRHAADIGGTFTDIVLEAGARRWSGKVLTTTEAPERGVIDGERKTLHPGKIIAGFMVGTQRLYDFVHDNPIIEMHPTEYVNDPFIVAQNDRMVAINSAIEVDLTGQVCADSIGPKIYSGVGGQVDMIISALPPLISKIECDNPSTSAWMRPRAARNGRRSA